MGFLAAAIVVVSIKLLNISDRNYNQTFDIAAENVGKELLADLNQFAKIISDLIMDVEL